MGKRSELIEADARRFAVEYGYKPKQVDAFVHGAFRGHLNSTELSAMGVELARKIVKMADSLDSNNACPLCGAHIDEGEDCLQGCPSWPAKALLQRAGEASS